MIEYMEIIIGIIASLWEIGLCYWVVLKTTEIEVKKWNCIYWFIFVLGLGGLLAYNRQVSFFSYLMFLFCILITVLSVLIIKKNDFMLILSVAIACYGVIALIEFFFAFISMIILQEEFNNLVWLYAASVWKNTIYIFSCSIITLIIIVLQKRKIDFGFIYKYQKILIVFDIIICILIRLYQFPLDGMAQGERKIQASLGAMVVLLGITIVFLVFWVVLKYRITMEENRFLIIQEELYQQKISDMEEVMERHNQLIHDIKNHLMVLNDYSERGENKKITDYIQELEQQYLSSERVEWTGNKIIDLILNQKKQMAEENNIKFSVFATHIGDLSLSDSEVCVLLGNLLDNAIEANYEAGQDKRIDIIAEQQEQLFLLLIKNSIYKSPLTKNGEMISTKREGTHQGFGLKSVNRVVKKYDGLFSYQVRENEFETKITLFDVGK